METIEAIEAIFEAIGAFLTTWAVPIGAIASIVAIVTNIIRALLAFKNEKDKTPKPSKENQLGDCKAAQYINKRNLLIFQAKQDARKRPYTLRDNIIGSGLIIAFSFIPICAYKFLPQFKEAIDSSFVLTACYALYLLLLSLLLVLAPLRLIFNAPSWVDMRKKIDFLIERALKSGLTLIEGGIKKRVIKKVLSLLRRKPPQPKKIYRVRVSQVLEIASNFDAYLLFDADSPGTNPYSAKEITSFKNRVIGAKTINPATSIYDMIKDAPSEKVVVFIYSQHGKTSHERAEEARTKCNEDKECGSVRIYDLGPVCGDMRDLEIVAHRLHYLQDGKCLRLPLKKNWAYKKCLYYR